MFTGIVTDIGEVVAVTEHANLRRLAVACRYPAEGIALGASICHSGICMTVVEIGERDGRTVYAIDAAAETLKLTTAGGWRVGSRVNLERSLKIGDELGGHIVTGHVDGLAEVVVAPRCRRAGHLRAARAARAGALHRRQGLGGAGRHLAHRQHGRGRRFLRPHHPAHPGGDHLG